MDVQLFVTCLIDSLFPETGEAVVEILAHAGCSVHFKREQTCCGQPAYNAGFWDDARAMAVRSMDLYSECQMPLIVPSGSCVHMIRHGYPELFQDDPPLFAQAQLLAERTYELSEFLIECCSWTGLGEPRTHRLAYHPSCHLLRGLEVREQPLEILRRSGYDEVIPLEAECCGFGGVFAVDHALISNEMLLRRMQQIESLDVDAIVGCDVSCLMNIEGALRKRGSDVRCMHLAALIAGQDVGLR